MGNETNAAEPSGASAGSRGSASRWSGVPVAWAAVGANGVPMWLAYHRQDAERAVVGMAEVVPLYRSPTLTDEERGVLSRLGSDTREWDKYSNGRPWFVTVKDAAIIRGILERLG